MLDDARKALHDLKLACDALQRWQRDEADRYLQDVEIAIARIRRDLKNPANEVEEPRSPKKPVTRVSSR